MPIGRGEIVREGRDLTLFAYGSMVSVGAPGGRGAREARHLLRRRQRALRQAARHGAADAHRRRSTPRILTLEEHLEIGGFGAGVLEAFHDAGLPTEHLKVHAIADQFVDHSPQLQQRHNLKLDVEGVVEKVLAALPRPRPRGRQGPGVGRVAQGKEVRRDGDLVSDRDFSGSPASRSCSSPACAASAPASSARSTSSRRPSRSADGPVYVRKEIIHNRYVVDELRDKGARFVEEVDEVPDDAALIFSAHGIAPAVRAMATAKNLQHDRRDLPARHQGAPRGDPLRPPGLHDHPRRPPRPRRDGRHARRGAGRDPPGRDARKTPRRSRSRIPTASPT